MDDGLGASRAPDGRFGLLHGSFAVFGHQPRKPSIYAGPLAMGPRKPASWPASFVVFGHRARKPSIYAGPRALGPRKPASWPASADRWNAAKRPIMRACGPCYVA